MTKEDAINTLRRYSGCYLIVASKVSGKYIEICCSSPRDCVYWNMERKGLGCVRHSKIGLNAKGYDYVMEFKFLTIRELYEHEYYEPRATGETHHHISWILIGEYVK